MSFDHEDSKPIIEPAKRTTKVNISMVIAVIIFFIFGALAIVWMKSVHGF
jgi:hypothetical protein